jgi:hypothetical protein
VYCSKKKKKGKTYSGIYLTLCNRDITFFHKLHRNLSFKIKCTDMFNRYLALMSLSDHASGMDSSLPIKKKGGVRVAGNILARN